MRQFVLNVFAMVSRSHFSTATTQTSIHPEKARGLTPFGPTKCVMGGADAELRERDEADALHFQ